MDYASKDIRNILVAGHAGCGKTTLTEALLNMSGATERMGRVEDGTTASDFDNWDKVSFTIDGDALAESTSDNNTFTAVATATGSATVSAHWAMDTTADSATVNVTVQ